MNEIFQEFLSIEPIVWTISTVKTFPPGVLVENLAFNFDLTQIAFYHKAQEFEEKKYKHYLEMSNNVEI